MAIPNFFIAGTPKAGTTSLYHYLEEHPDVYMSPVKETNYFSYEDIKAQGLFYNEEHISTKAQYLAQFAGITHQKAIGEASVSYLFYPDVPAKIKAFNPDAKIIVVLRHPVDRGFSHYLMDKRLGFVNVPYEDIVRNGASNPKTALYYQQYVSLGLYYEQLKRYFSVFDNQHVQVFLYEEIISDIAQVISRLYRFLEVDDTFQPDIATKHNVFEVPTNPLIQKLYTQKVFRTAVKKVFTPAVQNKVKQVFFSKEKKPVLSQQLRDDLIAIYKEDVIKTSALLDKDLTGWIK